MARITFPAGVTVLWPEQPRLATQTVSSGPGLDGRSQYVDRGASLWTASVVVRAPRTAAGYGAFMAFLDRLRGPVNTFDLPVCNPLAPSASLGGPGEVFVDANGGVLMSNSTTALLVDANPTLDGSHAAGAKVLTLAGSDALMLQVGALLTLGRFLYRVVARDGLAVSIEPGLRQSQNDGVTVRVANLEWEVRLASDQSALDARVPVVGRGQFQIDVVEAFER